DLACPTCGAPRETGGVAPARQTDRPSNVTMGRPISEVLDLNIIPTANGNGSTSTWEDAATYPDTTEDDKAWDDVETSWDEPARSPQPWSGHATAPSDTWTPTSVAAPAPAPSWTPPPPIERETRPLPIQTEPPPRFTPAPVPQRTVASRATSVEPTTRDDDDAERFALLGGLDPRRLSGISRRTWLVVGVVIGAIVIAIAVVFALEQWQRALNAEHELDATRSRVTTQSETIEGLSGRVLNLNSEIGKTEDLLTRAQDQAAVSGKDLDALSTAIGELSQARELMRAAVLNITKMTQALELEEFKEAGEFAAAASSQLEQAFVHEQRASQSLN
ncbi:MAG: hypothetical protein WD826_11615, partial [Actinomycetota bacterium]